MVALAPDVILAIARYPWFRCFKQHAPCRLVFVAVQDPVCAGFVDSLSRPGGIATGFVLFDYSLSTRRALFGSGSRSEKVARGHRYCCPIDIECNPKRISTFSHHFDLLA